MAWSRERFAEQNLVRSSPEPFLSCFALINSKALTQGEIHEPPHKNSNSYKGPLYSAFTNPHAATDSNRHKFDLHATHFNTESMDVEKYLTLPDKIGNSQPDDIKGQKSFNYF